MQRIANRDILEPKRSIRLSDLISNYTIELTKYTVRTTGVSLVLIVRVRVVCIEIQHMITITHTHEGPEQ